MGDDLWKEKKQSNIFFYQRLSNFFNDKISHIKLVIESEKKSMIDELFNSSSFQNTHSIIAQLSKFTDFTDEQINAIMNAAVSNNQIYLIKDDCDVDNFLKNIIYSKKHIIDSGIFEMYNTIYKSTKEYLI